MKRLQILMSTERLQELDELVRQSGLKTRTDLVNSALTLFEWAFRERLAGRSIGSLDEEKDRFKEIDLPGLPNQATRQALLQAGKERGLGPVHVFVPGLQTKTADSTDAVQAHPSRARRVPASRIKGWLLRRAHGQE